jgi:hypothetical protein
MANKKPAFLLIMAKNLRIISLNQLLTQVKGQNFILLIKILILRTVLFTLKGHLNINILCHICRLCLAFALIHKKEKYFG